MRAEGDAKLVERLAKEQIPLTVCPLSNVYLHGFETMEDHNLKRLLDLGLCVTVNSDDPAYFGGYMTENYLAIQKALNLDLEDIRNLAVNAIQATFLGQAEKQVLQDELDSYFSHHS